MSVTLKLLDWNAGFLLRLRTAGSAGFTAQEQRTLRRRLLPPSPSAVSFRRGRRFRRHDRGLLVDHGGVTGSRASRSFRNDCKLKFTWSALRRGVGRAQQEGVRRCWTGTTANPIASLCEREPTRETSRRGKAKRRLPAPWQPLRGNLATRPYQSRSTRPI